MPELPSEIIFFVLRPSNALVLLLVVAVVCLLLGANRIGLVLVTLATVGFVLAGFAPLGKLLLRPLEDRYEKPEPMPESVTGILVFGGAIKGDIASVRQIPEVNDDADRLIAVADLAKRYPDALVAISNGPKPEAGEIGNAEFAARLFESFGVARDRIRIEDRALSTWENALYLKELLKPKPGDTWIVVTSAWHMPRTMGILEKVGWSGLVPWPVDYRTLGNGDASAWTPSMADGLFQSNVAAREWLALIAYYLTGKTPALVPGPATSKQQAAPASGTN